MLLAINFEGRSTFYRGTISFKITAEIEVRKHVLQLATVLETQEQANKKASNYCTHKFYPRRSVSHSSLAIFRSLVDIYSLYRGTFYVFVSGWCAL